MWYSVAVAAASLIGGCDAEVQQPTEKNLTAPIQTLKVDTKPEAAATSANAAIVEEEEAGDTLTPQQRNAVRSAEQYLAMSGFSRDGLIQQLSSDAGEGYPLADATAAVDSLIVDWNENAARSAKQYLDMSGFSCKGLIEQLSSDAGEKYTVSQATYGARAAGAC
jgi:hypothetical protein